MEEKFEKILKEERPVVISNFKTLNEYKKVMKTFIRGIIKSKLFRFHENGKLYFFVTKTKTINGMFVSMKVEDDYMSAEFQAEVPTRIYNKIIDEFYTKNTEQFNKLKGFAGITVIIQEEAIEE